MIPQDPFRRPIPLQSLTDETGQWMWNRPPEYADVDDFVDAIEKKLTTDETARDDILDMLLIGATVEDVVNTLALAAFSQGKITPDAAEIAKVPIAAMILQMAIDKEIPVPGGGTMKLFENADEIKHGLRGQFFRNFLEESKEMKGQYEVLKPASATKFLDKYKYLIIHIRLVAGQKVLIAEILELL